MNLGSQPRADLGSGLVVVREVATLYIRCNYGFSLIHTVPTVVSALGVTRLSVSNSWARASEDLQGGSTVNESARLRC